MLSEAYLDRTMLRGDDAYALSAMTDAMNSDEDPTIAPSVQMRIAQAVTNQKVEELKGLVNEMRQEVRDLKSSFVTKAEFLSLAEEVRGLRGWNSWVAKSIGGLILAAIIGGLYLKGGIPRP